MRIELSEEQVKELRQTLDIQLVSLAREEAKTDDRAYREGVRRSLATLEAIRRSLESPSPPERPFYLPVGEGLNP